MCVPTNMHSHACLSGPQQRDTPCDVLILANLLGENSVSWYFCWAFSLLGMRMNTFFCICISFTAAFL